MTTETSRAEVAHPRPAVAPVAVDRVSRFRRRARTADALVVTCWMSAAAAVALFLSTGGAYGFTSISSAVTGVGVVAGLVGTDLVLVMLVLAARIPLIDRTIGHDRAMATHRRMGKPALYLLLAHGGLLVIGYGLAEGIDPVAEVVALWSVPDMPLAFLAIGLMILVVVTSLVAVRRRFPYELWFGIHLLSYAAVLTALPHQLSLGGVLAENTVQRAYWIGLYVTALGSIVVFRLVRPVVRSIAHGMRVSAVESPAPGVFSIHLEGRDLRSLRSAGGQFFIWRFWTGSTWWHSHPISLSALPTDSHARITLRTAGPGSSRLSTVPVGTAVSFEGPYGLFTDLARTSPRLAVVAAGIGVTPIRALLEHSRVDPGEVTVLLRGSSPDELFLKEEMKSLAAQTGTRLYHSTGHRSVGPSAWLSVEDAARGVSLATVFPDLAISDLYICGPAAWMDTVEAAARAAGLPDHRIHSERFDW